LLQTASATATGSSGSPPRIRSSFYVAFAREVDSLV
jgi:hypothetical protein